MTGCARAPLGEDERDQRDDTGDSHSRAQVAGAGYVVLREAEHQARAARAPSSAMPATSSGPRTLATVAGSVVRASAITTSASGMLATKIQCHDKKCVTTRRPADR